MQTSDFNFNLPEELIAQFPAATRSASRMLVVHRESGTIEHRKIIDLPDFLTPADLLILNNTKVFPARLLGTWADTAGAVELLLTEEIEPGVWLCVGGSGRKMRPGFKALFGDNTIRAEILSRDGEMCTARIDSDLPLMDALALHGHTPLPPYIQRQHEIRLDNERYQTVYAQYTGAVAAPTAGLHFDESLFARLDAKGVAREWVTLHVGPGTFKPVKADTVEEHRMDPERYEVSQAVLDRIAAVRRSGGRAVAVGSTSVRTLETAAATGTLSGKSTLFIYPPYTFRNTDCMLTNFHLPKSTLLMMVSALAGRDLIFRAYEEAIRERYRFFSYGDCMLIL